MTQKSTALVARSSDQIQQLRSRFDPARFIVAVPETHLERLPEGTMVSLRTVEINVNDDTHVYPVGGGKMGLSRVILDQLSAAAGITIVRSTRTDDRRHAHYCEFEVVAKMTDFDGTSREAIGTKTFDMRDDTDGDGTPGPQLAAMSGRANEIKQARKFLAEHCQTRAQNRAIAKLLGIPRGYMKRDLQGRKFVLAKLVPDPSHPLAQQATMAAMFGAQSALFGPQPAPQLIEAEIEPTGAVPPPEADEGAAVPETAAPSESSEWDKVGPPPMEIDDDGYAKDPAEIAADILKEAWGVHSGNGGNGEDWVAICKAEAGHYDKTKWTPDQARKVLERIKADAGVGEVMP
jgi:hypothetical protein